MFLSFASPVQYRLLGRSFLTVSICALLCVVAGAGAMAQEISGNFSEGSVRIGADTAACDAGRAGAIRYNAGAVDLCDGSAWTSVGTGSTVTTYWLESVAEVAITATGAWTDIPNTSQSVTVASGDTVLIDASVAYELFNSTAGNNMVTVRLVRDSTQLTYKVGHQSIQVANYHYNDSTLALNYIDTPGAGAFTYKLQALRNFGSNGDVKINPGNCCNPTTMSIVVVRSLAVGGAADNLGDHTATENLVMGSYWLSGDGGNEGLAVDASGNVGIGTASPAVTLDIAGIMRVGGVASVTVLPGGSDLWTASGSDIYYNTGKVGIGTTSPTQTLHVAVDTASGEQLMLEDTGGLGSKWTVTTSGTGVGRGKVGFYSKVIEGAANTGWKFIVDGDGKVGIGTASPGARLEISDSGGPNPTVKISADDGSPYAMVVGNDTVSASDTSGIRFWVNNDGTGRMQAWKDGTGAQHLLLQPDGGRVGIGTTNPENLFHVSNGGSNDTFIVESGGGILAANLGASAGNRSLCADATSSNRFYVNSGACGTSARRFKEDIQPLEYGLNELLRLKSVSYKYIESIEPLDRSRKIGFIAEDMYEVIPEVVTYNAKGEIESLDYAKLTSLIVKGMQEQQSEIGALKAEGDRLEADVEVWKTKFEGVEARLEALEGATAGD